MVFLFVVLVSVASRRSSDNSVFSNFVFVRELDSSWPDFVLLNLRVCKIGFVDFAFSI